MKQKKELRLGENQWAMRAHGQAMLDVSGSFADAAVRLAIHISISPVTS
jgi:hypothetical protein